MTSSPPMVVKAQNFSIQHILHIFKAFGAKFERNMIIQSQNTWCPVIRVKLRFSSDDFIGPILICRAKISYLPAFIHKEGTV